MSWWACCAGAACYREVGRHEPNARSVGLVLATSTGGVGTHVAALARGLLALNWQVHVRGPAATDELFGFSAAGAQFVALSITGGPGDLLAVPALRRASRQWAITHAHGLRAATVAASAAVAPLVVTWHNAVLVGLGPASGVAARR